MDSLRIRTYNVRFGDAILITVPDKGDDGAVVNRNILIDVGNVLSGEGGKDELFAAVVKDIQEQLAGNPIDLYVMTHEHLDHVQGLPYAAEKLGIKLTARYSWLTASSAPDYYDEDKHPDARKQHLAFQAAYERIAAYLTAAPEQETEFVRAIMLNNNPRSTTDCVEYLRGIAPEVTYVYRGVDITGRHPFTEAKLAVLGPEEDTSAYYGRLQPMALAYTEGEGKKPVPRPIRLVPPQGVDAGAFYDLVEAREHPFAENMLAIDKAANNTSVVLTLEWRGWKLLFPGDAELRSWQLMDDAKELSPVHVLKVAHHGSHNGTPDTKILDRFFPEQPTDDRPRVAILSTRKGTYEDVPDQVTLERLAARARIMTSQTLEDGQPMDLLLSDELSVEEAGPHPNPSPEASGEGQGPHPNPSPNAFGEGPGERPSAPGAVNMPQIMSHAADEGGGSMPDENIHMCIDRILDPFAAIEAADRAVEENPDNVPILRPGTGVRPPSRRELAAVTGKLWGPGRTLKVAFLDGDATVQAKVQPVAMTWMQFANVTLQFGNDANPEIRISFKDSGSWSYIGTDALGIPMGRPTMNFGWLTPSTAQDEYNRVVLHEFGHALGCIHEHQNPVAGIPWDKEAVYRYYAGPPNYWSREEVDVNLFQRYSETITQFTAFDTHSIMLYPIDNSLTIGDFEVGWNRELSATDKQFIGALYPYQAVAAKTIVVNGDAVEDSIGVAGEMDWFQFVVADKRLYRIETSGWTDTSMALFGPNNQTTLIGADDDSGKRLNAKMEAELEPGTYYVRIQHYRPKGTGKYSVSVKMI